MKKTLVLIPFLFLGRGAFGLANEANTNNLYKEISPSIDITSIVDTGWNTSLMLIDGDLYVSGDNTGGQLGDGTNDESLVPINITNNFQLSTEEEIAYAYSNGPTSSALTNLGSVYVWGYNAYGQLGNGTNVDSNTPINITDQFNLSSNEEIIKLSVGFGHLMALTDKGDVYAWGINNFGQLGNGTYTDSNIPINITSEFGLTGGEEIIDISLGAFHSMVITDEGSVYTWGLNNAGQLGDGTQGDDNHSNTPINITSNFGFTGGEEIIDVSLDFQHSAIITDQNTVYIWGRNSDGELGNGTNIDSSVPIDITTHLGLQPGEQIVDISLGVAHSMLYTGGGYNKVYTWGLNDFGQLGDGTTTSSNTPIDITSNFGFTGGERIAGISGGDGFSSILSNQGNVYTWGRNEYGQLGNGTKDDSELPSSIAFSPNVNITNLSTTPNSITMDYKYTQGNPLGSEEAVIEVENTTTSETGTYNQTVNSGRNQITLDSSTVNGVSFNLGDEIEIILKTINALEIDHSITEVVTLSEPSSGGSNAWIYWVVGGVVGGSLAVAGIIAGVWFYQKKKKIV